MKHKSNIAPKIALMFYGDDFITRTFDEQRTSKVLEVFNENITKNRYEQDPHRQDPIFQRALDRYVELLEYELGGDSDSDGDSPAGVFDNNATRTEEKTTVSPDMPMDCEPNDTNGTQESVRILSSDFGRDQDCKKNEGDKKDTDTPENPPPIDIDPHAPWSHVFKDLLKAGWKFQSHELFSKVLVKPGRNKKGGQLLKDYFKTDSCGHGDEVKNYIKKHYGWIGEESHSESSYAASASEATTSEKFEEVGDDESSEDEVMVNDNNDHEMEHQSRETGDSSSDEGKDSNIPNVIDTQHDAQDVFSFTGDESDSESNEPKDQKVMPWEEMWEIMQGQGWSTCRGADPYKAYYLKPGVEKVSGKYLEDYLWEDDVKRFAEVNLGWEQPPEPVVEKETTTTKKDKKIQTKKKGKAAKKKEIKVGAGKISKQKVTKKKENKVAAEKVSKQKGTKKKESKVAAERVSKQKGTKKKESKVAAKKAKGGTKRKQSSDQTPKKQEQAKRSKFSSPPESPFNWKDLKAVEGWTYIPATKYNRLHDWYYLRPGVDPGHPDSIEGQHYFLNEQDAIEYARENKEILQYLDKPPSVAPSPSTSISTVSSAEQSMEEEAESLVESPSRAEVENESEVISPGAISVESSICEDFIISDCQDCWWLTEKMPRFLEVWKILKKINVKSRNPEYILPDGLEFESAEAMQKALCKNGLPPVPPGSLSEKEMKLLTRYVSLAHLPTKIGQYRMDVKNSIQLLANLPFGSSFDNSTAWGILCETFGASANDEFYYVGKFDGKAILQRSSFESIEEIRQEIRAHGLNISYGKNIHLDECHAALILWSSILPLPNNNIELVSVEREEEAQRSSITATGTSQQCLQTDCISEIESSASSLATTHRVEETKCDAEIDCESDSKEFNQVQFEAKGKDALSEKDLNCTHSDSITPGHEEPAGTGTGTPIEGNDNIAKITPFTQDVRRNDSTCVESVATIEIKSTVADEPECIASQDQDMGVDENPTDCYLTQDLGENNDWTDNVMNNDTASQGNDPASPCNNIELGLHSADTNTFNMDKSSPAAEKYLESEALNNFMNPLAIEEPPFEGKQLFYKY